MNLLFKSEVIDYSYIKSCSKDTIIFLHGWGGDKFSFITTINLLKSKYNILTVTMPTINSTSTIWTLHDYADLIISLLTTHNIQSCIIICHSFGFRITSLLNGRLNIKKVVITGGAGLKKLNFYRNILKNNKILLLKTEKFRFLYKKVASQDYINLPTNNKQTFKNIVNLNTKNLIKFSCPLLLFWGKNDHDAPIWIAKKIKHLNNSKLITTSNGHFAYLEDNTYFNNCVTEFLK